MTSLRVLVLLAATGCAAPELEIACPTPSAHILVDGRDLGRGDVRLPVPYYGTARVEVLPALETDVGQSPGRPAAREVALPPPAPRWLFPFDLVIELARLPWRPDTRRAELELAPGPELPVGAHDPQAGELRRRAERMRIAR